MVYVCACPAEIVLVAGVALGLAGPDEQPIIMAEELQYCSCLPLSCTPIVRTPLINKLLTLIGPHVVPLVVVVPISTPSKYRCTVVEAAEPVSVPDIVVAEVLK